MDTTLYFKTLIHVYAFLYQCFGVCTILTFSPLLHCRLTDKHMKDYKVYKGTLVFFGLVERLYSLLLKEMTHTTGSTWPVNLASYIRNNDEILLKAGDKVSLN